MDDLLEYYGMIIKSTIPITYNRNREYVLKDIQRHFHLLKEIYQIIESNKSYSLSNNLLLSYGVSIYFRVKINKIKYKTNYCGYLENIIDTNCVYSVVSDLIPPLYDNNNNVFFKYMENNFWMNNIMYAKTISPIKKFQVNDNIILEHFEKFALCLPTNERRSAINFISQSNHKTVSMASPCIALIVTMKKEIINMRKFGDFKMKILYRYGDFYGVINVSDYYDSSESTQFINYDGKIMQKHGQTRQGTSQHITLLRHYKTNMYMTVEDIEKINNLYVPVIIQYYENNLLLNEAIKILPEFIRLKPYLNDDTTKISTEPVCYHEKCSINHIGGANGACYGRSINYIMANRWLFIKEEELLDKNVCPGVKLINKNILDNNQLNYEISIDLYHCYQKILIPFDEYIFYVIKKVGSPFLPIKKPSVEFNINYNLFVEIQHPQLYEYMTNISKKDQQSSLYLEKSLYNKNSVKERDIDDDKQLEVENKNKPVCNKNKNERCLEVYPMVSDSVLDNYQPTMMDLLNNNLSDNINLDHIQNQQRNNYVYVDNKSDVNKEKKYNENETHMNESDVNNVNKNKRKANVIVGEKRKFNVLEDKIENKLENDNKKRKHNDVIL